MTKDQWINLTGKSQWDCQVALRGPDLHNSATLKYFTTGVVRAYMAPIMRVGGQLSRLDFVCLPDAEIFFPERGSKKPQIDLNHFIQHVHEAALVLNIPIISIPSDLYEVMVMSHYEAALKILNQWAVEHVDNLPKKFMERLQSGLKYGGL